MVEFEIWNSKYQNYDEFEQIRPNLVRIVLFSIITIKLLFSNSINVMAIFVESE